MALRSSGTDAQFLRNMQFFIFYVFFSVFVRCHSVTFLKLPEKIALILIPDNPGLFLQSKALYRTTEEPSSEIFFFAEAPENCIRFFALSACIAIM